jgi:MOSC domain-containing protein YiiM
MDEAYDLTAIQAAPRRDGRLEMIARRPAVDARETPESVRLDPTFGVEGDDWLERGSGSTPDGAADPTSQVTLISTRVLAAIEPDRTRWALAGDQLYVDFDVSLEALPAGSRIAIGEAVLEVSEKPHTGCAKFSARFGSDALRWINSPTGRVHRMRGVNTRVITGGTVRVGDRVDRI